MATLLPCVKLCFFEKINGELMVQFKPQIEEEQKGSQWRKKGKERRGKKERKEER